MGNIGETAKNKFLLPLQQNDVMSVYSLFHPELKEKFELPLLIRFVRALNEALGSYVKVVRVESAAAMSIAAGKSKSQSGELEFSNGNLEYSVTFGAHDQIMAFFLYSAKTPKNFVKDIETDLYIERSLAIIRAFYVDRNPAEIHPHFHLALQGKVGVDDLKAMINKETNRAELGNFVDVVPEEVPAIMETTDKDGFAHLTLNFKINREFAVGKGVITWVFTSPMKGQILGFEFCIDILSVKNEAQAGDGLKNASQSLQQVVNFNTEPFVANMHNSLKTQIDAEVLKMTFKRFLSNGGPMTETIEDSLKKAKETFETMPNGMKTIKVVGSLAYEKFNLIYSFAWVNNLLIQFNVKPDPMTHVAEINVEAVKAEIAAKTKHFLLSIVRMNKLQEAKAVIDAGLEPALEKTQKVFRDKIRSASAEDLKFDIVVGDKNPEDVCGAEVTFSLGTDDSTFIGHVDWQLAPLKYIVVDWGFKNGAQIAMEKRELLRAPLRSALQKHGVRVFVEKAVNLAAADSNGFSDPYVKLSIGNGKDKSLAKVKSKVIKKNLNPVWNELLAVHHVSHYSMVKVEVWDKDTITDDFLGQVRWTLEEIYYMVIEKGQVVMPFALKDKKDLNKTQGEIYLKFVFTD